MKKAVLILTVLVLFSTLASAMPNVGIGLWGRTQFNLAMGSTAPNSTITQGWGPAFGSWNPEFELEWWFNSDNLDFNFKTVVAPNDIYVPVNIYVAAVGPNAGGSFVFFQNLYTTIKVIPDLLTIRVGKNLSNGFDWYRRADVTDAQNNNTGRMQGAGFWFTIAPKDSNFSATIWYKTPVFSQWDPYRLIMQNAQLTELVAAYTLPNMMKITAGTQTSGANAGPGGNLVRSIFGRVDLLMVSGLSCFVDVRYDGLEPAADISGPAHLDAMIDAYYTMDALTLWLVPKLHMAMPKAAGTGVTGWEARLGANYNLGDFIPALEISASQPDLSSSVMGIGVTPSVQFTKFNTNLSIPVGIPMGGAGPNYISWAVAIYTDVSFW